MSTEHVVGEFPVYVAIVLWGFNGWFQGFGAPASVVSITQWFSGKKRGTMYGLWSSAHSLGEGLTYFGTSALVAMSVWNAAFIGPGLTCLLVAVGVYLGLRDRPQTLGLPPVNEWAGQPADPEPASTGSAQLAVLRMPAIWVIGLSSSLMYVTRYAINNWGILYLQEVHKFSLIEAGILIGINTVAGAVGCIAYGYISDRYFKARRPPLTLIFGIIEVAVEKGADTVLMPVSARKQLFELSDDMATRINIQFYSDTPDALLKALLE